MGFNYIIYTLYLKLQSSEVLLWRNIMAMNKAYLTCGRTAESDECLTPRYAVYPIIKYLKAKGFKTILSILLKKEKF